MFGSHGGTTQKPKTPDEQLEEKKTAIEIKEQLEKFLLIRRGMCKIEDPLNMTKLIIQVSPEIYTTFNFRKELLLEKWKDQEALVSYNELKEELNFTLAFQKRHPKNYTLWYHRVWLLKKSLEFEKILNFDPLNSPPIYSLEIALCTKMLGMDERNFHVWNYRNYLINLIKDIKLFQKEIEFCNSKIQNNFSNYSAFHFKDKNLRRYHIISLVEKYQNLSDHNELNEKEVEILSYGYPFETILKEFEMLSVALIMESKEQGTWFHLKNLLNIVLPIKLTYYFIECFDDQLKIHLLFNKEFTGIKKCNFRVSSEENEVDFYLENQPVFSKFITIVIGKKEKFKLEILGARQLISTDILKAKLAEELISTNLFHEEFDFEILESNYIAKLSNSQLKGDLNCQIFVEEVQKLLVQIDQDGYNKHSAFISLYIVSQKFFESLIRCNVNQIDLIKCELIKLAETIISNEETKRHFLQSKLNSLNEFCTLFMDNERKKENLLKIINRI